MSEEVYTVEQFAERLKLHPKTVLRFIRDGRLRAVKVGKSYRILRTEMEAMTGFVPAAYQVGGSEIEAMIGRRSAPTTTRVTSIVDFEQVTPQRAQHLARMLPSLRTGPSAGSDLMNLSVAYDPATRGLKIVIVGSPGDTAAMLKMIDVLAET